MGGTYEYDCSKHTIEGSSLNLGEDVRVFLIVLTVIIVFLALTDSMGIEPGNAMLECYRALEDLYSAGKIRDIGAYKFSTEQLEYLLRRCAVVPAMLQAEFHPYLYRKSLVDICRFNSIRMQGFCFIKCVEDPVIISLSYKYRKAPAQIILRWIIQHGVGVLPKSKTPSHIKENANVFDFSLTPSDMERINALNQDRSFTPYSNNYYGK